MPDYTKFDVPSVISYLFYPRPEDVQSQSAPGSIELSIPVESGIHIGGKIHVAGKQAPTILFFHGNGEIVADYDDLGPLYIERGINFVPVDYRGYGRSGGRPSVSSMMQDCHAIFDYTRQWLSDSGYSGKYIIMGRSLGSASALELASSYGSSVDGLIIDSGFAYALPLLRVIGVNPDRLDLREEDGFMNVEKIRQCRMPTLVIHARLDHIIPYSDGVTLFESSPAEQKKMLTIPQANHNTIFMYGLREYMTVVAELIDMTLS
jgi:pimeloyl-ACP methyl ester carboxylesterase